MQVCELWPNISVLGPPKFSRKKGKIDEVTRCNIITLREFLNIFIRETLGRILKLELHPKGFFFMGIIMARGRLAEAREKAEHTQAIVEGSKDGARFHGGTEASGEVDVSVEWCIAE